MQLMGYLISGTESNVLLFGLTDYLLLVLEVRRLHDSN